MIYHQLNLVFRLSIAIVALVYLPKTWSCSSILLVSSNSHFGIVHRIEASLTSNPLKLKVAHLGYEGGNTLASQHLEKACLIVTIGSESLERILKSKTKIPVLSILTRKNVIDELLLKSQRRYHDPEFPFTAIYIDQPLERQLNLIKGLLTQTHSMRLGILIGPDSADEQEALQKLSEKHNIQLTTIVVKKNENPVGILDALLDEANVVLAIPDNNLYNPKTSRGILLTAFHKRVPLIGYSRTFVNNGALAAVYSSTKQISDQSAQKILSIIENKSRDLPEPEYPNEFSIAVNYQVARSLGIAIDSEAELKNKLDKLEKDKK